MLTGSYYKESSTFLCFKHVSRCLRFDVSLASFGGLTLILNVFVLSLQSTFVTNVY